MQAAAAPSCVWIILSTLPPVLLSVSMTSSTAEEGALSRYSRTSLQGRRTRGGVSQGVSQVKLSVTAGTVQADATAVAVLGSGLDQCWRTHM
jgi:hypothetical protein